MTQGLTHQIISRGVLQRSGRSRGRQRLARARATGLVMAAASATIRERLATGDELLAAGRPWQPELTDLADDD